jgi:CBS domain containing-hemolysin-like protein
MEWVLVGVSLLLIAGTALFVAAEFSLVTVDRSQVEAEAEAGDGRSRTVLAALRELSTQLSGAQLGITVTTLVVGFLAQPSIAALLEGPLTDAGVPEGAVTGIAVTIALLVATGVSMVLGELVPKNLAIARPFGVARAVTPAQRGFTKATGPLIRLLNGNSNALLRKFGVEPTEELASARSAEELLSLVRRSATVGTLDKATAALLDRSLQFGERTVADVLTPRSRVQFVSTTTSVADVVALARSTGHSRFPVQGSGGIDDVVGVADLRGALRVPRAERDETRAASIAAEPLLVPESLRLDALLVQLRTGDTQMAIVIDEYAGTAGVVTLEDLVEELVGELEDEHDRPLARIRPTHDGGYLISALLRPDEVRDLDVAIPESPSYETIGGFVALALGRIPERGDAVEIPGWTLSVIRMDGRRVDRVRLDRRADENFGASR